jgi:hypothetical protein
VVFGYSVVKPALGFAVLAIVTMKRMSVRNELHRVCTLVALFGRTCLNISTRWDGLGENVPTAGSDMPGSSA